MIPYETNILIIQFVNWAKQLLNCKQCSYTALQTHWWLDDVVVSLTHVSHSLCLTLSVHHFKPPALCPDESHHAPQCLLFMGLLWWQKWGWVESAARQLVDRGQAAPPPAHLCLCQCSFQCVRSTVVCVCEPVSVGNIIWMSVLHLWDYYQLENVSLNYRNIVIF